MRLQRRPRFPLVEAFAGGYALRRHFRSEATCARSGAAPANSSMPPNFVPAVSSAGVTSGSNAPVALLRTYIVFSSRRRRQRRAFLRLGRHLRLDERERQVRREEAVLRRGASRYAFSPVVWRRDVFRGPSFARPCGRVRAWRPPARFRRAVAFRRHVTGTLGVHVSAHRSRRLDHRSFAADPFDLRAVLVWRRNELPRSVIGQAVASALGSVVKNVSAACGLSAVPCVLCARTR